MPNRLAATINDIALLDSILLAIPLDCILLAILLDSIQIDVIQIDLISIGLLRILLVWPDFIPADLSIFIVLRPVGWLNHEPSSSLIPKW